MALIYLAFEEKKPLLESAPRGIALFAAAGFMNVLSSVFAYTELSVERVSIISPLINSSSLFVLSFLVAAVAQGGGETHPAQNRRCVSGDLRSLADFLGKKL